jgi:hypothetical protein
VRSAIVSCDSPDPGQNISEPDSTHRVPLARPWREVAGDPNGVIDLPGGASHRPVFEVLGSKKTPVFTVIIPPSAAPQAGELGEREPIEAGAPPPFLPARWPWGEGRQYRRLASGCRQSRFVAVIRKTHLAVPPRRQVPLSLEPSGRHQRLHARRWPERL